MAEEKTKLWYLERINLLRGLSEESLEKIRRLTTMRNYSRGEYIYFPNDPASVVFFLKTGRVKIGTHGEDKEMLKTVLYPGEVFGELSILGQSRRQDFAMALDDDVRICAMPAGDMEQLLREDTRLNLRLSRTIGERLMNVERRLEDLISRDARSRIIGLLKKMAEEHGRPVGEETELKHDLTHQDIANLTATSRQTVTQLLNDLRKRDKIYMERGKILFRDLAGLG